MSYDAYGSDIGYGKPKTTHIIVVDMNYVDTKLNRRQLSGVYSADTHLSQRLECIPTQLCTSNAHYTMLFSIVHLS
jgi:hypothetical protein